MKNIFKTIIILGILFTADIYFFSSNPSNLDNPSNQYIEKTLEKDIVASKPLIITKDSAVSSKPLVIIKYTNETFCLDLKNDESTQCSSLPHIPKNTNVKVIKDHEMTTIENQEQKDFIYDLVKPHIVYAIVNKDTYQFKKGEKVEILMDKNNGESYKIFSKGKSSWVKKSELDVQKSAAVTPEKINKNLKEEFVNYNNFKSETPYFIWVDLQRHTVNIFKRKKKNYELIKTMTCASGKDKTPTVRGNFKIEDRGLDFYEASIDMGAKYWVRFYGSYLFHSLPTDEKGNILDTTLGQQATHGCIRLSIKNSKWIYDNIPKNTSVWIN